MKRTRGFTLIEIMVVVSLIAALAAIAIPAYSRARANAQARACANNLRQISGAKDEYALDNNNADPGDWSDLVSTYISKTPLCKGGGVYKIDALGTDPTCARGSGDDHSI
jgi:prepilin-type N-terminal cleavage/methylation domain-containing protein